MSDERSSGKDSVEKALVDTGAAVGGAVGGAVVTAAAANVAAAASAAAAYSSLAASPVAAVATGPFAAFSPTAGPLAAALLEASQPAIWAALATNPIGMAILISGGAALGAFSLYKLAKKILIDNFATPAADQELYASGFAVKPICCKTAYERESLPEPRRPSCRALALVPGRRRRVRRIW